LSKHSQWEGYEEGEGEQYYGEEGYEEGGEYSELNDGQPQNIPPEVDPNVSYY
jgi:hypothetical protein